MKGKNMSRLIDADVFEVVCLQGKSEEFCEGAKYILEMLDAQPTAFDVDMTDELIGIIETLCDAVSDSPCGCDACPYVDTMNDGQCEVYDAIAKARKGRA